MTWGQFAPYLSVTVVVLSGVLGALLRYLDWW